VNPHDDQSKVRVSPMPFLDVCKRMKRTEGSEIPEIKHDDEAAKRTDRDRLGIEPEIAVHFGRTELSLKNFHDNNIPKAEWRSKDRTSIPR
jgi:hypothetical protein